MQQAAPEPHRPLAHGGGLASDPRARFALTLQRTAGNRAAARMLQRVVALAAGPTRIDLRLPDDTILALDFAAGDTIADLRAFVAAQSGADPETIELVCHVDGAGVQPADELVDGMYTADYPAAAEAGGAAGFGIDPAAADVLENARYISQDNPGLAQDEPEAVFYHVGRELAYTYNLVTCSAITLRCLGSQLSFLDHIDAEADPDQIMLQIREYLSRVRHEAGPDAPPRRMQDVIAGLTVEIYHGTDETDEEGTALHAAIESLRRAGVTVEPIRTPVSATDLVVVGGGQPHDPVPTGDILLHARFALREYIENRPDTRVLTTTAREWLLDVDSWARFRPALDALIERAQGKADADGDQEVAQKLLEEANA